MKQYNITEGPIIRPLLYFFFPILFGTFFQQLYNTVDALIVGNILGKEALAAVGGTTSVYLNIFVGFFVGLSAGATVLISQYYGSSEYEHIQKTVHTSFGLGIVIGIGLTILGFFTAKPSLLFLGVPKEILDISLEYIFIYFIGFTFLLIYDMGCSILRAIGDSKRPLYYLIISCIVNIMLDILFIGHFKMGIAGAAYATVISEAVSAILVVLSLMLSQSCIHLNIKQIKLDLPIAKQIIRIGLPAGIQSMLYTISNLVIATRVNALGVDVIAANTAFGKIDTLFWMVNQALGIAITTFVGQNFGAKKYGRVKKGLNRWLLFGIGISIVMSIIFMIFAPTFIRIFNQDQDVIKIGIHLLFLLAPFWCTYIPVEIISGGLRGLGDTTLPTIITAVGIVMVRCVWLFIFDSYTLDRIMWIYPITWILTSVAFIIYYYCGLYKRNVPEIKI